MTEALPQPVARLFEAANANDPDAFPDAFVDGAWSTTGDASSSAGRRSVQGATASSSASGFVLDRDRVSRMTTRE
jgi:hypothetical protein